MLNRMKRLQDQGREPKEDPQKALVLHKGYISGKKEVARR